MRCFELRDVGSIPAGGASFRMLTANQMLMESAFCRFESYRSSQYNEERGEMVDAAEMQTTASC